MLRRTCHAEPFGNVPSTTNVELSPIFVPLLSMRLESPANGTGVS